MNIDLKINGVPVLGNISVDGITYYVDTNKTIYTLESDGTFIKVDDVETLKKILGHISPRSMDVR